MILTKITLTIEDREFDIRHFNYHFCRDTDAKGRPCSRYYGGMLFIEMESLPENYLMSRLVSFEQMLVSGKIEVWAKGGEQCIRRIKFEKAYICHHQEEMNSYQPLPMLTTISISPLRLDINKKVRIDRRISDTNNGCWDKYVPPKEEKKSPPKKEEQKKEDELSLFFNGKFLLFSVERDTEILRFHYKAVSGRPSDNGSFDYHKYRQKMKDVGPIPEGEYWINPQEIQYTADRTTLDKVKGFVGPLIKHGGTMPGGEYSWGSGRVWIQPQQVVVEGVLRHGFSIHGGESPGSAGCIDLTDTDKSFFDKLVKYRGNKITIPLIVKY